MKLIQKLLLAPALTACLVLVVAQVESAFMFEASAQAHAGFASQSEQFKTINDVQDQLAGIHTEVYRTMAGVQALDGTQIQNVRTALSQQMQGVGRVLDTVSTHGLDAASLEKAHELSRAYITQVDTALGLAQISPQNSLTALAQADAVFETLKQHHVGLVSQADDFHTAQAEIARLGSVRLHWALSAFALTVALAAVWASWLALRKVTAELANASTLAQQVATGNLLVPVVTQRTDEVGDLVRALCAMQGALAKVVDDIRGASGFIAVSGTQIATGTQDLARRTESASNHLEETTRRMAELTANVHQSADAAAQANRLASGAAAVAAKGGEVVRRVVSTMDEINQSSRKIADIIGVIDGIAFQTNILALNAAVEAARAGEAGKGFAVVATEVRSLAGRSAQAAKEIKNLIQTSVQKVQSGLQQVEDAGNTMGEIVASVKQVTEVMADITSAAHQQSHGIGQIHTAVNQLDQMTQENTALVQQSTAAAEGLKAQAQRLATVVGVFKTPGPSARSPEPT